MNQSIKELLDKNLLGGEVAALNSLLSGEITAVEAYKQAIQNVKDSELILTLQNCLNSHALRVQQLKDCLEYLGASPRETAGLWGGVARLVEGGASMMSDSAAITVLAAGEDYGLREYETHIDRLDPTSSKVVTEQLLPAQRMTHWTISLLRASLKSNEKGA